MGSQGRGICFHAGRLISRRGRIRHVMLKINESMRVSIYQ